MCEKLLFTPFSLFICLDALFMAWTVYQALVFKKNKKKKKAENAPTLQTWMCYPNRAIVLINYQPRQIPKNHCFLINYQLFEIVFERYGYFPELGYRHFLELEKEYFLGLEHWHFPKLGNEYFLEFKYPHFLELE